MKEASVDTLEGVAIRAEGLTRRFGALTAVDGLSFQVRKGELFGLVGPDGAGKTTTMRMLAALMTPSAGEAWVAGCHTRRQAEALKRSIAYMGQRFGLYPDLTVAENIDFFADLYGVPRRGRGQTMDRLLSFSDLGAFKKRQAGRLSGGMKQKLALVCALVHTPQVLLLDEPTNGVDPVSRRDFWRILYQLQREGVTVFVSTAYLDEAERCSRLALIANGRMLACGTPDEVKGILRGTVYQVRTPDVRRAALAVREKIPGASAGVFGDTMHVILADDSAGPAFLESFLRREGIAAEVAPAVPTLEDVFVAALVEKEASREN